MDRIILKWVLKIKDARVYTGLKWLIGGTRGQVLKFGKETSLFTNCEKLLLTS